MRVLLLRPTPIVLVSTPKKSQKIQNSSDPFLDFSFSVDHILPSGSLHTFTIRGPKQAKKPSKTCYSSETYSIWHRGLG